LRIHIPFVLGLALLAAEAHAQSSAAARASRAEVALSNDTLQLRYMASGGEIGAPSTSRAAAGFLLTEDRDIVFNAEVVFPADLNLGPVSILFGPRAYAALLEDENSDVMALSLGAEVRFDIIRGSGLAVVGNAFYAPDILTFGSADNMTDLNARVEMRVAERLTAFAGMRWFEFDLTEGQGENTLMEEVYVGAGWRF
jgi:YfaZ precursor